MADNLNQTSNSGAPSWMQTVAGKVQTGQVKPNPTSPTVPANTQPQPKADGPLAQSKPENLADKLKAQNQAATEPKKSADLTQPPPPSQPKADGPLAQAANLKDSPFKKLIPFVLGLAVIGLIVFIAIQLFKRFSPDTKPSPGSDQAELAEAQTEPITLTWWGLWEPKDIVAQVILDYQRNHPQVTVDYIQQSHKDYRERLQSALARGDGPDIFRFHNTWVPMLKKDLAIMPSSVYSNQELETIFYPVVKTDLNVGGSYIGIPLMYDGLALFYNRALLAEKNIEVPTTWEQFRKVAVDITQRDEDEKITLAGAAIGTTNNVDNFADILALMLLQNGASLSQPTGQLAQDAFSFYTLFSQQDRVWDETLPDSYRAFANGQVAMILAPSWRALEIKATNPSLDFGVGVVPQLPGTDIAWASYWIEGVANQSAYQAEAWQFLKYLSQPETLQKLYSTAAVDRGLGEIYPRTDMADLLKDDPIASAFINQAPKAQSWYMCSRTHDNGIDDRIIKYYEDALNAWLNGDPAEATLETLSQGISQILTQYKISK